MSKKLKTGIALLCGLVLMAGCKKFVEHDDVNINPNRAPFLTLATALPAVQYTTANSHSLLGYVTTMFSQQMASYPGGPINDDRNQDVRINTGFESLYSGLTNSKLMVELARGQGSPHYRAIARVIFVTNMSLATDTYGDLPLTEAFRAPEILQPKYDKQEDIYAFM
ncbi:MAG TPA: SusD/RagB family nutrient-binding outer membrane lipoprotein, partial [Pseudobacter sp.]|nr:SusD/RagB family nutrient-binding outer membrane lipoprotein [Pseudobacter sp.]